MFIYLLNNKFYMKSILFIILLLNGLISFSQEGVPIKKNKQFYIYGNATVIGNNIVSKHAKKPFDDRTVINDEVKMKYVDIDEDPSTFSSSQATLSLPKNHSKIVYAALYWSAIYKYEKGALKLSGGKKKYKAVNSMRDLLVNEIKFKTPNNSYQSIIGEIIYDDYNTNFFPNNTPYVCYADVTTILRETNNVNGDYNVANVRATQGYISGGCSGGWMLYVVYEAPTETPVYISTYDGFVQVNKKNESIINFKNFKTKKGGIVNTNITIATLEGDHKLKTDQCLVLDPKDNTYKALGGLLRKEKNFFNSRITFNGHEFENRKPFSKNTLGFDLLQMELSNADNELIPNNVDQVSLKIKTKADRFYLFFTAFQTDISKVNYIEYNYIKQVVSEEDIKAENLVETVILDSDSLEIKIKEPVEKEEVTIQEETTFEEEVKIKKEDIDTSTIEEKDINKILNSTPLTISSIEKGYYLVTNVFSKQENTKNWVDILKSKGYFPRIFTNPKNNWEYVYIYNNEDVNLVYIKYKELYKLSHFKDMWVMKINLP